MRKETARRIYRNKIRVCLYRTKNGSNYIYIIVGNKKSVYVYTETKLVYVYTKQKTGVTIYIL